MSEHDHSHGSHTHVHATGSIRVAFFLNLAFTIAEFAGGLWTNSLAILSDAVHDLGDSLTLGLSWFLEERSKKGRDAAYSYGYRRHSLLGALVAGSVLLAGSLVVISRAIPRLMHPEHPNAKGMLAFAVVGVLVNGAAILRLRGGQSMNARVVALHLLEDVLGWVAVLVVSVILLFKDIPILDPVLSLIITAYVLYNAVVNLRRTLVIFLQSTPRDVDIPSIEDRIAQIPGVSSVHHTHAWSLDGIHHVLTTHVVVPDATPWPELQRVKKQAKQLLRELDFISATIEVEHESEECEAEE